MDLLDLERRILELHQRVTFEGFLRHARKAGELLLEAKKALGHGQWLPWLRRLGLGVRTCQVYMQVARTDEEVPDSMSLRSFLRMVARARVAGVNEEREANRQALAELAGDLDDEQQLHHADCRDFNWPDQVDAIVADPPWDDWSHYRWLRRFASTRLTKGGLLCVQCYNHQLAALITMMRPLRYLRTMAIVFYRPSGGVTLDDHTFIQTWRPVVVFSRGMPLKGLGPVGDSARSVKHVDLDPWQQPLAPWKYWLAGLTRPRDVVADPWAGVGTIAVACRILGRRYIGTEIRADQVRVARGRLDRYSR